MLDATETKCSKMCLLPLKHSQGHADFQHCRPVGTGSKSDTSEFATSPVLCLLWGGEEQPDTITPSLALFSVLRPPHQNYK